MSDRQRAILLEMARLVGAPNPEAVVETILAPPCQHHGEWTWDPDEVCPEPCGQRHYWCTCGRPMRPPCPILADLE